jgi:hypothetical protein
MQERPRSSKSLQLVQPTTNKEIPSKHFRNLDRLRDSAEREMKRIISIGIP